MVFSGLQNSLRLDAHVLVPVVADGVHDLEELFVVGFAFALDDDFEGDDFAGTADRSVLLQISLEALFSLDN